MLIDELEMSELVVPPLPSVFSALGMMTSDLSFTQSTSVLKKIDSQNFQEIKHKAKELELLSTKELLEKTKEISQPLSSITARVFIEAHTYAIKTMIQGSLFTRFIELHQDRFSSFI